MTILIVGASRGLGNALVSGLAETGRQVIGVSRTRPGELSAACQGWIEADLSRPREAVDWIERHTPERLDVILYNVGLWEAQAFEENYDFLADDDQQIAELVTVNITAAILLLKRLLPKLLGSAKPQIILTGSTSGLPQSGRPEVTFGATKFALRGIVDALREGFRDQSLAVTCLQLGYLNTDDGWNRPRDAAVARGGRELIPVHDVVNLVKAMLDLSSASYVKELVLSAIGDQHF